MQYEGHFDMSTGQGSITYFGTHNNPARVTLADG